MLKLTDSSLSENIVVLQSLLPVLRNKPKIGELFGMPKSTVSMKGRNSVMTAMDATAGKEGNFGKCKREDSDSDNNPVAKVTHVATKCFILPWICAQTNF